MKISAYRQMQVSKNGRTVRLTFVDEKTYDEAKFQLRRYGFQVDADHTWFRIERNVIGALLTARHACDDTETAS